MKTISLIAGFLVTVTGLACADTGAPAEQNFIVNTESVADKQARLAWWKEARFGMFVHWGLYSTAEGEWNGVQGSEWIQKQANVPADVYADTLLPQFKPAPDFSEQWARLAKQAGAKYVVFTTKHHEGFCLHDSAETEFDANDSVGRDLHQEIVSAIRREGLKVGVYYSLWDWHHPDAPAGEGALNIEGLTMEDRDLSRYRDYFHAQVNEITDGRYGPVDILWLDFSRNQYQGEAWGAKSLVEMIRKNQPDVLINNRLWKNEKKSLELHEKYWLGDFSTPEQHIPATGIEGIDWETCDTLNGTWGWAKHKTEYRSSDEVIHRLVNAVSKGGNYLLNIGPLPDGTIHPQTIKIFEDIGEWMRVNGEAIYGTHAGPFRRLPWGRATAKELNDDTHRLYLHVFEWPKKGELLVPGLNSIPVRAFVLGEDVSRTLEVAKAKDGMLIEGLPEKPLNPAATVIALDYPKAPEVAYSRIYAADDGSFTLEPVDATVKNVKYLDHSLGHRSCLDSWEASGAAVYPLKVEKRGNYEVEIAVVVGQLEKGDRFVLSVGNKQMRLELEPTGADNEWKVLNAGVVKLPRGDAELKLQCKSRESDAEVKIATITLTPVE